MELTDRDKAVRFIAYRPAVHTLPELAVNREALRPIAVRHIGQAQSQEERELEVLLPRCTVRGGKHTFTYERGWGHRTDGDRAHKSYGYESRIQMAYALWTWAGHEWSYRVRYELPEV
jgi:hypothetical protein